MDNCKIDSLKNALVEVRKAHRLVYSYQERMLSLVNFIKAHLDGNRFSGVKHFSEPIKKKAGSEELTLPPGMWAWDYLYSYLFEYYIYEETLDDDSGIMLSVVQYADTGFFDSKADNKLDITEFIEPEKSISKLMFIMEHTPKGKKPVWRNWEDLRPYIENKKYASAKHKSDVIYPNGEGKTRLLLYSVPLEQFADERSSIEALKGYLSFLKKQGIELELV